MKFIDDSQFNIPLLPNEKQGKKLIHLFFADYIKQYFKKKFLVTKVKATNDRIAGIFRSEGQKYYFKIKDTGDFEYNYLKFSPEKFDSKKKKKKNVRLVKVVRILVLVRERLVGVSLRTLIKRALKQLMQH